METHYRQTAKRPKAVAQVSVDALGITARKQDRRLLMSNLDCLADTLVFEEIANILA